MDDNQNQGLFPSVMNWFAHPFNTSGSAFNWLMFVGIFIIAVWFWNHILLQIQGEI